MIDMAPSRDLVAYVIGCLPDKYPVAPNDVRWLEECQTFLKGDMTRPSVLQAVKDAVANHGVSMHIDPFELLIDAGICDAKLNLRTE